MKFDCDTLIQTVNSGAYPNASHRSLTHGVTDYETMWVDMSDSYAKSGTIVIPSVYLNTSSNGIGTYVNGDYIYVVASNKRTGYSGIITIKYTKKAVAE